MAMITTEDAAARLNVTTRRVVQMIGAGRLKAKRYGHIWLVDERNLAPLADRRPGRPRTGTKNG